MKPPAAAHGSRGQFAVLGVLLAGLLFARSPGSLTHAQFWAEDGTLFFQEAFNLGFPGTLLRPASGYLHTVPRLVAGMSLLFPVAWAPLIFNLAAFGVQLLPALYLLSRRMAEVIPAFPARVLAATLTIALPASVETHANITNSHWHLALAAVFILVARQADSPWVRGAEAAVVALFSLTGPFSILFLPLVVPRLLGASKDKPPGGGSAAAGLVAAGAVIQAGFALASPRAVAASGHLSLGELAAAVSLHTFFNALFGINGTTRVYEWLPPAAHALGLLAIGCLLYVAIRDRVKPLLILFYLAALSIALSFAFPLNDVRLWLHPRAGPRYFLFACLFIHGSLLHLALAARSFRSVGLALLALAAAVGIPADFVHPRQPDVHWADQVAVFQSLPAGRDFFIPVVPLYHGGLVLHKSSPARGPSPLAGLRSLPSRTPALVEVSRPERVSLNETANTRFIRVAGWAIDASSGLAAAAVYVQIDDSLFPAVTGLPAGVDGGDGRACTDCGYSRLIPIAEVGPGSHEVSIVVTTRDGAGFHRPTEPQTLVTSRLFP